jgi:3',5'-cyclic AMP phosphodiesterase CpdA
MFVLAHLSDLHLAPVPWPRPLDLLNKRVLGFLNWQMRRRTHHRIETLSELIEDMKAAAPDHIAITGDLVNISLENEFASARSWLQRLGKPGDITMVPGNHDAYVRACARSAERVWGEYMGDVARGSPPKEPFPFVRRRGPVALVGVSTAIPTGPFSAAGKVGDEQLQRLEGVLAELDEEELFRALVIHHPPVSTTGERHKRLIDAQALRETLKRHAVEIVIHGHEHIHSLAWIDGPARPIPVFGVPSASAGRNDAHPAGYNLYRIERGAGGWNCEAIFRGFRRGASGIVELARRSISAPRD